MSYVIVAPEIITAAAADVATIGSTLDAANRAAALVTVALAPAAADEVSASIAELFSQHAQAYQAATRQAAVFLEQFVQNLLTSSGLYAVIEAVSASFLHEMKSLVGEVVSEVVAVVNPHGYAALDQLFDGIQPQLDQWVKSYPGLAIFFGGVLLINFLLFAIAFLSLGEFISWALPAFFSAHPVLSGLLEFIAAA
jgi:PE family